MRYRLYRISLLSIAVLTACPKPEKTIEPVAGVDVGVAFGESVAAVRAERRNVQFRPYVGWSEEMSRGPIGQILFDFGAAVPEETPNEQGRLRAVTFIARPDWSTTQLLSSLDSSFGSRQFLGCNPVPGRREIQEIALLQWPRAPQMVIAEVLTELTDAGVTVKGPVNVTVAPRQSRLDELGVDSIATECRSRAAVTNQERP
jgi:hypothetical protein